MMMMVTTMMILGSTFGYTTALLQPTSGGLHLPYTFLSLSRHPLNVAQTQLCG